MPYFEASLHLEVLTMNPPARAPLKNPERGTTTALWISIRTPSQVTAASENSPLSRRLVMALVNDL